MLIPGYGDIRDGDRQEQKPETIRSHTERKFQSPTKNEINIHVEIPFSEMFRGSISKLSDRIVFEYLSVYCWHSEKSMDSVRIHLQALTLFANNLLELG